MNVGSMRPIAWNNSKHVSSWQLYLDCGIEETGSPGIICIVCHPVLCHPPEHGTIPMGKHWLAKAHITKLNELTVSEVPKFTSSTVDETALAILKWQGSRGIPIGSSQRKFRCTVQVLVYLLNWQTKHSKLAGKDFQTAEFHQDTGNRNFMLGYVSAYSAWNAISNLELGQS